MNRQDNSRIRLRVLTTTGIHILCTAVKSQKVSQWLPHFEQAYRQVKEEQEDDQKSRIKFIKALRIKKDSFHIANSEIIGDVFDDNDEVFCQISVPASKKQSKMEKVKRKKGTENNQYQKQKQDAIKQEKNQINEVHKQRSATQQIKNEPFQHPTKKHKKSKNKSQSTKTIQKEKNEQMKQILQYHPQKANVSSINLSKLKTLLVKQQQKRK